MNISNKYKFIFIANPGCGSTSLRNIVKPYSDYKGTKRKESNNIIKLKLKNIKTFCNPLNNNPILLPLANHARAYEIENFFKQKGWDWSNYISFTTVRNPWAKMVSRYFYAINEPSSVLHKQAKMLGSPKKYIKDSSVLSRMVTIEEMTFNKEGFCIVDEIIRLEDIDKKLPPLLSKLGIEVYNTPHLNRSQKVNKYRKYFDSEAIELVRKRFESDIEIGKYEF